jgi:hypothetical protein
MRLQKSLEKSKNLETLELSNKFFDAFKSHINVITERMETVEDLAGLGMAVEKSSHDSIRILSLMTQNVKSFKKKIVNHKYQEQDLIDLFDELEENLNIVHEDMQMIQPLFKIQRQYAAAISTAVCRRGAGVRRAAAVVEPPRKAVEAAATFGHQKLPLGTVGAHGDACSVCFGGAVFIYQGAD